MRCDNFAICSSRAAHGQRRCSDCCASLDKKVRTQLAGPQIDRCPICLEDQGPIKVVCRLWSCKHHVCLKCVRRAYRPSRVLRKHAGVSRHVVNRWKLWIATPAATPLRENALRCLVDTMEDFSYFDTLFAQNFVDNHGSQIPACFRERAIALMRFQVRSIIRSTAVETRRLANIAMLERCCFCKIE